jgi:hypothetical protein
MKIKSDLSGFDKLVENADKTNKTTALDILTNDFIKNCSKFSSVDEFFIGLSPLNLDPSIVTQEQKDSFVKNNTKYNNWNEMMSAAFAESAKRLLLKGL